ncbi:MAG: NtaA/DmoA family FMN-dependent monooxygenase [Thermomicrobiales bacterium]|nr:NtaA/DmoA family FMN-dependent monooxygenase [Thermomicrobiales bacterium]MCO5220740.1 NtaA/DmoA family FMN-dependent monooxygenase [Thermomicrobiales bacterium]
MSSRPTRQARMGTHFMSPRWNAAGWRLYKGDQDPVMDFEHYRAMAPLAERARFDFVLQSDILALHDLEPDSFARSVNRWPEPVTLASALAVITSNIGFVVTMSTTFQEPFHVARMIASLDHLSKGRASWNVVTSNDYPDGPSFRLDQRPKPEQRPEQSLEFVNVVKALWDSWDDDAIVFDRENGIYADRSKVHEINHNGTWHTVQGPLNVSRPPQGHPVILTAGGSADFRERASKMADVLFTAFDTIDDGVRFTADVRERAQKNGRQPDDVLVMPTFAAIIGETETDAQAKWKDFQRIAPHHARFRGTNIEKAGRIGSYRQIADQIEQWWEAGAVDGFVYVPLELPVDLQLWADLMAPELQRRGVLPTHYEGSTLRENLGLPRPAVDRSGKLSLA